MELKFPLAQLPPNGVSKTATVEKLIPEILARLVDHSIEPDLVVAATRLSQQVGGLATSVINYRQSVLNEAPQAHRELNEESIRWSLIHLAAGTLVILAQLIDADLDIYLPGPPPEEASPGSGDALVADETPAEAPEATPQPLHAS